MKYIVNLLTQTPISLRAGREQNNYATLDYIPGNVVLGTLATAHTLLREDSTEFNHFFFDEQVRVSHLYPASFKRSELGGGRDPVYPLPKTAMSCKRFTGFLSDGDPTDLEIDNPHGVWDSLIAWTLFACSGQQNFAGLSALQHCPHPPCEESLDHFEGFYRRTQSCTGKANLDKELRTRTGINRKTGIVEQGILYNREIISKGTNFWGTITLADEFGLAFDEFVQAAQEYGLLRLGNNRTRGLGNVILNLIEDEEIIPLANTITTLQERVELFNNELKKQAKAHQVVLPHDLYIPITLHSEVILMDASLRYSQAITPNHLAQKGISGAELVYQNSQTESVVGWHHLWGLPKADELAISLGSVFLFGFKHPFDSWQALAELQTEGLGLRLREGFGQLMIANPFHWEVQGL